MTGRVVTAVTTTLLRAFAAGPAGVAHPAIDNLAGLHEFSGDPIAAGQAAAGRRAGSRRGLTSPHSSFWDAPFGASPNSAVKCGRAEWDTRVA